MARIEDGKEILDSTPKQMPVGFEKPESLVEKIQRLVRSERLAQAAQEMGMETPEEADDFDIGDDYDPRSPYELDFDQEQIQLRENVNAENPEYIEEDPANPRDLRTLEESRRDPKEDLQRQKKEGVANEQES